MSAAAQRGAAGEVASHEALERAPWPHEASHEPSMKIGEVVDALRGEFPALSISKLRYLEAEGLISPHRVGNGYRRYSPADVARLRFALSAQRDEYLPLSVIRDRLDDLDAGLAPAPASQVARVVAADGRLVAGERLDADGVQHYSGATAEQVGALVDAGIITADARGLFGSDALSTVRLCLRASEMGVPLRNLRAVRAAAEREADTIVQAVEHRRRRSRAEGQEAAAQLAAVLAELHASLLRRAATSED